MSTFETLLKKLADRLTGPLSFRFILQPLIAILLGIRDGHKDAKAGLQPYVLDFLIHPYKRWILIKNATASVLKPVLIGIIIDAIAQYLIFNMINPFGAIFVGSIVIAVPYVVTRGLTNRFVSRKKQSGFLKLKDQL